MKLELRRVLLPVLAGVLVYGAFVAYSGLAAITESLQAFKAWTFLAALCLSTANYGLRVLRWNYYLKLVKVEGVSALDRALLFLSGFVLTITPGKLGEVFKSAVMAETHAVPLERTAPIVVAERLTDVIGIVILVLAGALSFSGGLPWAFAGIAAIVATLIGIVWEPPAELLLRYLATTWLRRFVPRVRDALVNLRQLASPQALVGPTLLALIGWSLEGTALAVLLHGFGQDVAWLEAVFFYATATLAGALIPVPGGLGVTEALIQQQLSQLGAVEVAAATSSMLLLRLATLWWAVVVGFLALGWLRVRYPALLNTPADSAH